MAAALARGVRGGESDLAATRVAGVACMEEPAPPRRASLLVGCNPELLDGVLDGVLDGSIGRGSPISRRSQSWSCRWRRRQRSLEDGSKSLRNGVPKRDAWGESSRFNWPPGDTESDGVRMGVDTGTEEPSAASGAGQRSAFVAASPSPPRPAPSSATSAMIGGGEPSSGTAIGARRTGGSPSTLAADGNRCPQRQQRFTAPRISSPQYPQ